MITFLTYLALGITIIYHTIGIVRHGLWFRKQRAKKFTTDK